MIPFVSTKITDIIESIRLLEAFVTSPLGLYSDIKMLRESLHFPEAADFSRGEMQERWLALRTLVDTHSDLVLDVISSLKNSIGIIEKTKAGPAQLGLDLPWITRAHMVLDRAQRQVAGEQRCSVASRIKGLYVIIDQEFTKGRTLTEVAEATLSGGAHILQYRDKINEKVEVLAMAKRLKKLCEQYGALFIINDAADVALSVGADGLHVGQSDLPVEDARLVLKQRQILGRSNGTLKEIIGSQIQDVDYMALGAIYPTYTMGKRSRKPVGLDMVREAKELTDKPIVAIGGISATNIADVIRAGANCVCVVSAVTLQDDPESSSKRLIELIHEANQ